MVQRGRKSAAKIVAFPQHRHIADSISAPSHFQPEERALFDKIAGDVDLRSNSAAAILEIACMSHARARQCRDIIKKEGMTISGQNGDKAHPLLAAERQAHAAMLVALRRLGATLDE